ncbi:MAG: DUF4465 domain-containing protein [Bacteroidales bacterium]|nr:DUF4465 domain-containing protein [Bacteroidales bacterium]
MKKFYLFIPVALLALVFSSCLKNKGSEYSQQFNFSFDPSDYYSGISLLDFDSDSLFIPSTSGFQFLDIAYLPTNTSTSGALSGGWMASMCQDPIAAEGHTPKNEYVAFGKGGNEGSWAYGVYYDNPDSSQNPSFGAYVNTYGNPEITQNSLYVNNTNSVVNYILYGEDKFGPGDWFLLTISGYAGGSKIADIEVYLADFRGGSLSLIQNWTEVKLNSIVAADAIKFSLTSSKPGVPRYFCMDDYIGKVKISY